MDKIDYYLNKTQNKKTLRFLTCGSVDDGKSTLIGRLLFDSKKIYEDQLFSLEKDSQKFNTTNDKMDLALLVDGLQSEREQGITIDVAYRYFSTDKCKFIIADTPGHEQYTRNMVTGASNCDLAIILIDASSGIKEQTRRHSFIVSLLGIKQVVVAVNKMDSVDYSQTVFNQICNDYINLVHSLDFTSIQFIPISALKGENVVQKSLIMDWFQGPTLLKCLENVVIDSSNKKLGFRFSVQYVNRSSSFRGYSGTIASGSIKIGDTVVIYPSGKKTTVKSIVTYDGEISKADYGDAVIFTFNDEIDISRGDLIADNCSDLHLTENLTAMVVWMNEVPLQPHRQYQFKFATKLVTGHIAQINYCIDVTTSQHKSVLHLHMNEIGNCMIQTSQLITVDPYVNCKETGSFIIIDILTNATVGAGMVLDFQKKQTHSYNDFEIELNTLIRKYFPHWNAKDITQ